MTTKKKGIIAILLVIFFLLIVPSIVIGEIIYSAPRNKEYSPLPLQEETAKTSDGVSITFWYSNQSKYLLIMVHGHADNAGILYRRAESLIQGQTYDVLFLDLRNHGRSGKKNPISFGVYESKDVLSVIEWATAKSWEKIVIYGTSMGSIATYMAYETLESKEKISGLILDSSFENIEDVLNRNLRKHFVMQPWRFFISKYVLDIRGRNIRFPSLLKFLNSTRNLPVLVIHGEKDIEAPPSIIEKIKALNLPNVTTYLVNDGKHSRLLSITSVVEKINEFLALLFA